MVVTVACQFEVAGKNVKGMGIRTDSPFPIVKLRSNTL
ncbi:hypothetical protein VCHE16_1684 [Vibrio paracholerae HE-16]|nr:hypothetical protein VCHE16_1684 [Vibrio paracholerae HE-16]